MASFYLPSWLHSTELAGVYTLGMSVTNTLTLVNQKMWSHRTRSPSRTHPESFTVASKTFAVIRRPSLSTGKV